MGQFCSQSRSPTADLWPSGDKRGLGPQIEQLEPQERLLSLPLHSKQELKAKYPSNFLNSEMNHVSDVLTMCFLHKKGVGSNQRRASSPTVHVESPIDPIKLIQDGPKAEDLLRPEVSVSIQDHCV